MTASLQSEKVTLREVRMKAASRGFLTMRSLADAIGCSRQSIYFAIERPTRYSGVFKKLMEELK